MFLKIILISRLCWEILDANEILTSDSSNLNQLGRNIRKIYKGIKKKHYELYFRYSMDQFVKVFDQYSYKIFFKMDATKIIYMYLLDCDSYIPGTRHFLQLLDSHDCLEEKYAKRSKYDVEMMKPQKVNVEEDDEVLSEKIPTTRHIIMHALRHKKEVDCFNSDMLLRYQTIAALKKGFNFEKDALVHLPSSDIKFDKLQVQVGKKGKKKRNSKK